MKNKIADLLNVSCVIKKQNICVKSCGNMKISKHLPKALPLPIVIIISIEYRIQNNNIRKITDNNIFVKLQ